MKTLLTLSLISLSLVAHAQLTTNIITRVTFEKIDIGVSTNSSNNTLTLSYSNAKEKAMIEGAIWDYKKAQADGQTNVLEWYLARVTIKDRFKALADDKNRFEQQVMLGKIIKVFELYPDLITTQQRANAAEISNLLPAP